MTDLEIIKQIEKELNVKLEKFDQIEAWVSECYTLNSENQVTGLSLYKLAMTKLSRIISFLKDLGKLQSLNLSSNKISDISFLKDLGELQSLDLSNNKISDISFLKDLGKLQSLNLSANQIRDLSFLKDLGKIQSLNLSNNQISDISFLKDLCQLHTLKLWNNQIRDIPFLKNLGKLQSLNLNDNQISDISFLKDLGKLQSLDLRNNPIKELPSWITDFNMQIKWGEYKSNSIIFGDNPLKTPPIEIVKQGKQAIKDYFKSLEKQKVKLNEVKVLLVGEGMAGKTSLLKQLQGLKFDKDESQTHGINVISLDANSIKGLENIEVLKECKLHFWDFGGQEIMHASHQFFMSERSLYILVLDSRTDSKKYHWLKHIEKFGGDSPVIIVMNKIDENPSYNIEQKHINQSFPNIANRFHRISCKTSQGIPELVKTVAKTIPETSLFGTDISIDWMNIKNSLVKETKEHQYISRERFVKICENNNVTDQSSQNTLLQYLHDLGLVLYFKELNLSNIYVLDPHWVTIGVYKIINSEKTQNGILNEKYLDYILNQEDIKKHEYDPAKQKIITYTVHEQQYIVNIMMQFELCYEYNKNKNQYIIPDLLAKELENEPDLNEDKPLSFVIKYDYLPSSVISRLMLRFKNDIVHGQQWRYGMILYNKEFACKAKVKSDEQNKSITINVQGDFLQKRQYFSAIRYNISDINSEFENLKIEELIPLPGYSDSFVKYKAMLGYEKNQRDEYFDGELGKSFSVSEMLDSVISKEERTMGNVVINKLENIGNPKQTSTQKSDLNAIQQQTVSQEIKLEVKNVQGLFKNLKQDILDEIDIEIEDEKEKKRIANELEKTETAFTQLEKAASQGKKQIDSGVKNRLKEFIENLSDKDSRINKGIKFVSKGTAKVQEFGRTYNKFAPFFGLPVVPGILVKK